MKPVLDYGQQERPRVHTFVKVLLVIGALALFISVMMPAQHRTRVVPSTAATAFGSTRATTQPLMESFFLSHHTTDTRPVVYDGPTTRPSTTQPEPATDSN